ncbi:MAG: hypothetical protein B7X10_06005 [Burkholderiales bacterium 21-58-4]|nr:MAG: hypothetical protein B7X10_06005 [Burkholderiales bacterium 21-58-4]
MADKMDAGAVMGKLLHDYDDWDPIEAVADKRNQEIESLKVEVGELKAKLFAQAAAPERKTDAPAGEKPNLEPSGGPDLKAMDASLKASGASTVKRLSAILEAKMGLH